MCTSPSATFAWVAAVSVNLGFMTLIAWGATTKWPVGFTLCGLYTLLLFGIASYMYRKEMSSSETSSSSSVYRPVVQEAIEDEAERPATPTNEERPSSTTPGDEPTPDVSVLVSLLFGLAVIAMAVTGSFLPINLFDDCNDSWHPQQPQWKWTTNISSLPDGVQDWGRLPYGSSTRPSSFGYLANVDSTYFSGYSSSSTGYERQLWKTQPRGPPMPVKLLSPDNFIALSNATLCFQAFTQSNSQRKVHCTDGATIQTASDPQGRQVYQMYDFYAAGGVLWAKQGGLDKPNETGDLIYSMDPKKMILELQSVREKLNDEDSKDPSCTSTMRKQASLFLFVVALPMVLISAALWRSRQIPSMGVTVVVGIHIVYASLNILIAPKSFENNARWDWWFTIFGALWLLVPSYFILVNGNDNARKGPLRWGLVMGGISYMAGTCMLAFDGLDKDTFGRWLEWNLVAFIPLIFIGASTRATFLMFLGAFGFLIDAARLAMFAGDHVHGDDEGVPVQFLVFTVAGIVVGGLGLLVNKHQPVIERFAEVQVGAARDWFALRPHTYPSQEADADFADVDSPLLHDDAENP